MASRVLAAALLVAATLGVVGGTSLRAPTHPLSSAAAIDALEDAVNEAYEPADEDAQDETAKLDAEDAGLLDGLQNVEKAAIAEEKVVDPFVEEETKAIVAMKKAPVKAPVKATSAKAVVVLKKIEAPAHVEPVKGAAAEVLPAKAAPVETPGAGKTMTAMDLLRADSEMLAAPDAAGTLMLAAAEAAKKAKPEEKKLTVEKVVDDSQAKWASSVKTLRGRLTSLDGHLSVVADYGKMVPEAEDAVGDFYDLAVKGTNKLQASVGLPPGPPPAAKKATVAAKKTTTATTAKAAPAKATQATVAAPKAVAVKATPVRAAAPKAAPVKAAPAKVTVVKATPAKAAPKATPVKAAPAKVTVVKAVPKIAVAHVAVKLQTAAEKVQQLRSQLLKVSDGLTEMLEKRKGALASTEIAKTMTKFNGLLGRVLSVTKAPKSMQKALKQLEVSQAGVRNLAKEMADEQAKLMLEGREDQQSLLLGLLMHVQNEPMTQQLKVLQNKDFANLGFVAEVLEKEKEDIKTPLYKQVAAFLDDRVVEKAKLVEAKMPNDKPTKAMGKPNVQPIVLALKQHLHSMQESEKLMEEHHKAEVKEINTIAKEKKDSTVAVISHLMKMKHAEERAFAKQSKGEKHDIQEMQTAIDAIEQGDMAAVEKARSALKQSLKTAKAQTGKFLGFIQLVHRAQNLDCPYCAAQCVDKCHKAGKPYVTCLTDCADAGK